MTRRFYHLLVFLVAAAILIAVLPAHARDSVLPSVRSRTTPLPMERPDGLPSDAELEAAGAVIGEVHINPR